MARIVRAWNAVVDGDRIAARLLGAAISLCERLGVTTSELEQKASDIMVQVRDTLGEEDFLAEWSAGQEMDYEQILSYAQLRIS
jgi:hypothetical protein